MNDNLQKIIEALYHFSLLILGKRQCFFFNAYVIIKFILDTTDIGKVKHLEKNRNYIIIISVKPC